MTVDALKTSATAIGPGIARAIVMPGAQKSGTGTLYALLTQLGDAIQPPAEKEPHFLQLPAEQVLAHMDWYRGTLRLGARGNRYALDASTGYLLDPLAVMNIAAVFDDPRILIVIRDPASRAYSAYLHMKKRIPPAESRSFSDIVNRYRPGPDLDAQENTEMKRAASAGEIVIDFFNRPDSVSLPFANPIPFADPHWSHRYFANSRYSRYVEMYEQAFPGKVHVVLFEEAIARPMETMTEICIFLGIAPPVTLDTRHSNKTRLLRSGGVARAAALMAKTGLLPAALKTASALTGGRLNRVLDRWLRTDAEKIEPGARLKARALLEDEYLYWAEKRPATRELWSKTPV